jgi:hypothetical protein
MWIFNESISFVNSIWYNISINYKFYSNIKIRIESFEPTNIPSFLFVSQWLILEFYEFTYALHQTISLKNMSIMLVASSVL